MDEQIIADCIRRAETPQGEWDAMPPAPGWASEAHRRLINALVRAAGPEAVYVEIGTWLGASVAAAGWNNPDARLYTVDDASETWNNIEGVTRRRMLETTLRNARVECHRHEGDFRQLSPTHFPPVDVAYYDAAHDAASTLAGMNLLFACLSPGKPTVLLSDDIMRPEVQIGLDAFLAAPQVKRAVVHQVCLFPTAGRISRELWNEGLWVGLVHKE